MANFTVSNLLAVQARIDKQYAAPEQRMQTTPALSLLTANSKFLTVNEDDVRQKNRPISGYYLPRTKRTPTGARSYNHTGPIADSAKVDLSWTSKVDAFSLSLKLLDDNVYQFNEVMANQMEQTCMNILEAKETEAIAYLRAQRATQQPTGLKNATFNATNDAVEVSADDAAKNKFFAIVRSVMRQNYLGNTNLDMIVDSTLALGAEYLAAQGAANMTNFGYQFKGLNIAESVELTDANYADGCALVMPVGGACAKHWIPGTNRKGWGDYMSTKGGYGTFNFMGYQFALHGYVERADTSTSNGDPQDVIMQFELSLDTSYNIAPINYKTNRTDSVVIEFGQAAPAEA